MKVLKMYLRAIWGMAKWFCYPENFAVFIDYSTISFFRGIGIGIGFAIVYCIVV